MKEIGIIFKEKREEIGIKEEEAAKDLEITIPQLENLEDGNVNAFKDIFFLKELIKNQNYKTAKTQAKRFLSMMLLDI